MRTNGRKRLGHRDSPSVYVGGTGGLFDEESEGIFGSMAMIAVPKFAHREIADAEVSKGIEGSRVRTSGFRVDAQSAFVRSLAESTIFVFVNEVGQCRSEIVEKTCRGGCIANDEPSKDGNPGRELITSSEFELGWKFRRPIDGTKLPTVCLEESQRLTKVRFD